jgi:Gluconate 2-dehydrogenase subunit 3
MNSDRDAMRSTLDPDETRLLEAVADRIFPATDTPGAVEIGAVEYIRGALESDYQGFAPMYHDGLAAVERCARTRFGKTFVALSDADKDAVLADFEADRADYAGAAEFFETVRCHVLEGVFGEPHYGGNRDLAGWRLVDFPGQQHGYPDAYINRRVDLPVVAVDPDEEEK